MQGARQTDQIDFERRRSPKTQFALETKFDSQDRYLQHKPIRCSKQGAARINLGRPRSMILRRRSRPGRPTGPFTADGGQGAGLEHPRATICHARSFCAANSGAAEDHLEETKGEIKKLEQVFKSIGKKASGEKCEAIGGLIKGADGLMQEASETALDAGLLADCWAVEHTRFPGTLVARMGQRPGTTRRISCSANSRPRKGDQQQTYQPRGDVGEQGALTADGRAANSGRIVSLSMPQCPMDGDAKSQIRSAGNRSGRRARRRDGNF